MRPSIVMAGLIALCISTVPAFAEESAPADANTLSGATTGSTWDQIQGNWIEFKGLVREQWGKLTDDDLLQIQGERQQLVGRIQALYGISLEDAESQVTAWENSVVAP